MALRDRPGAACEGEEIETDYVVVGSGAAGSALALSLAERGFTVAVIEAGHPPSELCAWARGSSSCVVGAAEAYDPMGTAVFEKCLWSGSGRCLGGGTSVNAGFLVEQRGYWGDEATGWLSATSRDVRPRWRALWADDDLHRCHCRVEKLLGVGPGAPDPSPPLPPETPGLFRGFEEACRMEHVPVSSSDPAIRSVARGQAVAGKPRLVFTRDGRRRTLAGLLNGSPGVQLQTGCAAVRLVLAPTQNQREPCQPRRDVHKDEPLEVRGVVLANGKVVHCRCGVVVCGGSEASARLLMHSGLGPAEDLARCGVPHVPGAERIGADTRRSWGLVGTDFMDHPTVFEPLFFPYRVLPDAVPKYEGTVLDLREGAPPVQLSLMSEQGISPFAKLLSRPTGNQLSIALQLLARVLLALAHLLGWSQGREPMACAALFGTCLETETRSRLVLTSSDPKLQLTSTASSLVHKDRQALERAARLCRRIASHVRHAHAPTTILGQFACFLMSAALALLGLSIPPHHHGEEALSKHVDSHFGTLWHPMGGVPAGRLLDERLRVAGINNLHVCGAAALPAPVLCNPMATCYSMGWRLGELLSPPG